MDIMDCILTKQIFADYSFATITAKSSCPDKQVSRDHPEYLPGVKGTVTIDRQRKFRFQTWGPTHVG